jgi:hypothetical protein
MINEIGANPADHLRKGRAVARRRNGIAITCVGLLAAFALTGCEPNPTGRGGEPSATASDQTTLASVEVGDGTPLPWIREDPAAGAPRALAALAEGHNLAAAPEVRLGSRITVTFAGAPPAAVALTDEVVDAEGTARYAGKPQTIELSAADGVFAFELPANPAAMLSSDSADYLPGAVIRGFTLAVTSEEGTATYAFALRTDAYR